jgi:hypothetical protein
VNDEKRSSVRAKNSQLQNVFDHQDRLVFLSKENFNFGYMRRGVLQLIRRSCVWNLVENPYKDETTLNLFAHANQRLSSQNRETEKKILSFNMYKRSTVWC